MDLTRESQGTLQAIGIKKDVQSQSSNVDLCDITEHLNQLNLETDSQIFHKQYCETSSRQNILKHSHKAYTISRTQQDISLFCLSLLQFEAQFPLRFYFKKQEKKDQETGQKIQMKDVWIQTQFLLSPISIETKQKKQLEFEVKIYKFFKQSLIPLLRNFKEQKMSWEYMKREQYTDQKVIQQFNESIVKKINSNFKFWCK